MAKPLYPVLLSGGAGVRLWPVSREHAPKPFIKLPDHESLLQKTYWRARSIDGVEAVMTVTNQEYYARTHNEFSEIADSKKVTPSLKHMYLLEPTGRNTAPAIAMAAMSLQSEYGADAVMLVLSADHLIENDVEFDRAVTEARQLADDNYLVTFGIKPDRPETGYGYILRGDGISQTSSYMAQKFVEKPNAELAAEYLKSGHYFWNAGIFCFKAGIILNEIKSLCPEVYDGVAKSWKATKQHTDNSRIAFDIDLKIFSEVPKISIDYAVFEKSKSVAIVPSQFKWSDIGSWDSLRGLTNPDELGNRIDGKAILVDTHNTYIQSRNRTVATVGIDNLIIVDTDDAVLIANPDKTQDVKKVVEQLKESNNEIYKVHKTVSCDWGSHHVLDEADNYKLRRLVINSGSMMSVKPDMKAQQSIVIIVGMVRITTKQKITELTSSDKIDMISGQEYFIENIGRSPVVILETSLVLNEQLQDVVHLENYISPNQKNSLSKEDKKNVI
jgi:mannose-1-phosphate guanylyltransferase/mannose-6-phosphate isomerase